jgi:hypothetical protein
MRLLPGLFVLFFSIQNINCNIDNVIEINVNNVSLKSLERFGLKDHIFADLTYGIIPKKKRPNIP